MATAHPMASTAASSPSSDTPKSKPSTSKPKSRPLPLSAGQEQQVRDTYYRNVRAMCADEIRAFAECANARTVTATWVCREQRNTMNTCMIAHATQENQDKARSEWFAGWRERKAAKEAEEVKKKEAEKFHREYWGLKEDGRRREGNDWVQPDDVEHARLLKEKEKELARQGIVLEKSKRK